MNTAKRLARGRRKTSKSVTGCPQLGPTLRTAHDVRHLVVCAGCNALDDDRHMVHDIDGTHWHGRCAIRKKGFDWLLKFRKSQLSKLTLGDLESTYARRLLDAWRWLR